MLEKAFIRQPEHAPRGCRGGSSAWRLSLLPQPSLALGRGSARVQQQQRWDQYSNEVGKQSLTPEDAKERIQGHQGLGGSAASACPQGLLLTCRGSSALLTEQAAATGGSSERQTQYFRALPSAAISGAINNTREELFLSRYDFYLDGVSLNHFYPQQVCKQRIFCAPFILPSGHRPLPAAASLLPSPTGLLSDLRSGLVPFPSLALPHNLPLLWSVGKDGEDGEALSS